MRKTDEHFQKACQNFLRFMEIQQITWEELPRLESLDPLFSGLNRFRWKRAVETNQYRWSSLRHVTIQLHAWSTVSPEKIMAALGKVYVPPDSDRARIATEVLECDQLTKYLDKPDQLGLACIQYAGRGHNKEAFDYLCKAFDREARLHLDRAMLLLDSLVYLGYRCMTPRGFTLGIRRYVIPHLAYGTSHRKCSPASRLGALAQLWCMANERNEMESIEGIKKILPVEAFFESDRHSRGMQAQLLRSLSVYESLRRGNGRKGRTLADDALSRNPDHYGNKRAVAMVKACAFRMHSTPKYGDAWELLADYYYRGRKELMGAMSNPTIRPHEMFHLFNSVYLGSNMRWLAREDYPTDVLQDDILLLKWCMQLYEHEIQMDDIACAGECAKLPDELVKIRKSCTREGFRRPHRIAFEDLVKAVHEVPC